MRAMILEERGKPLQLRDIPLPRPMPYEVLIRIHACGVCHTDLHILEGELPHIQLPLILGHQVIGVIEELGQSVTKFKRGERIGAPWLASTCHHCEFCRSERENLCDQAQFRGYTLQGGYADYCTAHEDFIFALPEEYGDLEAAPLFCAGLIGYRAFKLTGFAKKLGLYGFGSAAHLLLQSAKFLGSQIYVFTRPGDKETQEFALSLGAEWAGGADQLPPSPLDAALIFAPVGELYLFALRAVKKGGSVISAGIHMSDIPAFPYHLLWEERSLSSVANLTRQDAIEFLDLCQKNFLNVHINSFPLEEVNRALEALKRGGLQGSAVLNISAGKEDKKSSSGH